MSKSIESNEVFSGSERVVDLGKIAQDGPVIETATEEVLHNTGALDKLRFMNDVLEVYLHEGQGENEPKFCFVGVNGECMWLARGGTYQIKRKHVEVLARAKSGRVVQHRIISPDGSQTYIDKEIMNLQYPFSIISDPSPKGGVWLRDILQQST